MKKLSFNIAVALLFLISCQSDTKKSNDQSSDSSSAIASIDKEKRLDIPWTVVYNDTTKTSQMKKNPVADMKNLTVQDIIDALNIKYPQIKLEWIRQEGNKAFVKIADAEYLTQRMGTTGAEEYLAEATFSLTEIKGINAVYFDFVEGDHARPETLTRESFRYFK
jgi:hypothetical protein